MNNLRMRFAMSKRVRCCFGQLVVLQNDSFWVRLNKNKTTVKLLKNSFKFA